MKTSTLMLTVLLPLASASFSAFADEEDDFDLDFYFSKKQKSTLEDFPLQEIGSEELSDAAIAGALQTNSSGNNLDAKPVYEEQKEATDKKKVAATGKEKDQLEAEKILQFSQQAPPPQIQLPEFVTPSIRTLQVNSTTVERP